MRLLLDTHAFIWWDSAPDLLSPRALALCQDPENELVLSVASLWEAQIKSQLGRIRFDRPLLHLVEGQKQTNALTLLAVDAAHVFELDALPLVHKDPFDRMLIAQARVEKLRLLSHDTVFQKYLVDVEW